MHAQALRWQRAALRVQFSFLLFVHLYRKAGFNPDQPRHPKGTPEGGRWRDTGGSRPKPSSNDVRLASADKPKLGRSIFTALVIEAAKQLIEAYRKQNFLFDLFGAKDGTVAVTTLNDKDIYGVNSNAPTYTSVDRQAAEAMRDVLVRKYPEIMSADNLGQRPNDALFHAEATALLRAAAENGGTLPGRRFEIYVDNAMCRSCRTVLPKIGLELGNPTVTFVDTTGFKQTIRNGAWERW